MTKLMKSMEKDYIRTIKHAKHFTNASRMEKLQNFNVISWL